MYPNAYIWDHKMSAFKKKHYTEPIVCNHCNDLSRDWYVYFRFKFDGKLRKYKRREGINRIKQLKQRLFAIEELCRDISFDLKYGWNPVLDPKREKNYNPYFQHRINPTAKKRETPYYHYFSKGFEK